MSVGWTSASSILQEFHRDLKGRATQRLLPDALQLAL